MVFVLLMPFCGCLEYVLSPMRLQKRRQEEPTILPLPTGGLQVSAMSAESSAVPATPEMEVPTDVPSPTSPALDLAVATVPTVVPFEAQLVLLYLPSVSSREIDKEIKGRLDITLHIKPWISINIYIYIVICQYLWAQPFFK